MSQSDIINRPHGVYTRQWPASPPTQSVERFAYFEVKREQPETKPFHSTDRLQCPSRWSESTARSSNSTPPRTLRPSYSSRQLGWHSRPSTAQSACSNSSLPSIPCNVARYHSSSHSISSKASWTSTATWESRGSDNSKWSPRISAESLRYSLQSSARSSKNQYPLSVPSTGEFSGADRYHLHREGLSTSGNESTNHLQRDSHTTRALGYSDRNTWRFPSFSSGSATVTDRDSSDLEKGEKGNGESDPTRDKDRERPDWEERPRWSIMLNAGAFILCAVGVIIAVAFLAQYICRVIQGGK